MMPPAHDLASSRGGGVAPAATPRRVLVVDDNADAADLLAALLGRAGHVVAVAYNPLDALDTAADFGPEIAVLDIGLPVMDGYELGERLRALPATARCRIIALTGHGQAHDLARSERAGFEAHIVKPVDAKQLAALIGGPAGASEPATSGGEGR
jgi:CheY-like chemotaxis protein